ncbi:hypothetical protein Rhal01_00718 [Rubritalea halochordaticola]|uniref:SCP domain-containing protein n=1 Tax=Rubritalea halochordaticola TaxID=714537 RepID=A0ABP9V0E3_9BACT
MKTCSLIISLVLACLLASCTVQDANPRVVIAGGHVSEEKLESELFSRVNSERLSRGLPALYRSRGLDLLAQQHSDRMAAKANSSGRIAISHDGFAERASIARDELGYHRTAENVGVSAGLREVNLIATSLVDGWMDSRGHRKNILANYRYAGIAVRTASHGRGVYVTQMFGSVGR